MFLPRFLSFPHRAGLPGRCAWLAIAGLTFCAANAQGQAIILKDGVRIESGHFEIKDGKIFRVITLGNGQKAQAAVNTADIDSLDWPDIQQLAEAQTLLSEGKAKEAAQTLQQAKEYFAAFKSVSGSPYKEVALAYVQALDQTGDFDTLLRTLPEVEAMKWDAANTLKLRIIKLNMQRRTSSNQDEVLAQAKSILSSTDDSALCARLWMTIADIHLRKEAYEDAFMAALHVPVFYGSQAALVPQAELFAARTLVKMERFEDAAGFYQRIAEAYPNSEAGAAAKKELLPINGLKNKPDVLVTADAAKTEPAPSPATAPAQ